MSDEETAILYSSFESSRSSEFDQTEFENLTTRDERVDYLLAVRDKVRGLKLREVKYFCLKFPWIFAVVGFSSASKKVNFRSRMTQKPSVICKLIGC